MKRCAAEPFTAVDRMYVNAVMLVVVTHLFVVEQVSNTEADHTNTTCEATLLLTLLLVSSIQNTVEEIKTLETS